MDALEKEVKQQEMEVIREKMGADHDITGGLLAPESEQSGATARHEARVSPGLRGARTGWKTPGLQHSEGQEESLGADHQRQASDDNRFATVHGLVTVATPDEVPPWRRAEVERA